MQQSVAKSRRLWWNHCHRSGRDVSTFATLQPGVTPDGSVAGTVSDQAVFQLDGGNNSSDMDGSMQSYTGAFGGNPSGMNAITSGASGVVPMPNDSVEEFKGQYCEPDGRLQ